MALMMGLPHTFEMPTREELQRCIEAAVNVLSRLTVGVSGIQPDWNGEAPGANLQ